MLIPWDANIVMDCRILIWWLDWCFDQFCKNRAKCWYAEFWQDGKGLIKNIKSRELTHGRYKISNTKLAHTNEQIKFDLSICIYYSYRAHTPPINKQLDEITVWYKDEYDDGDIQEDFSNNNDYDVSFMGPCKHLKSF